MTEREEILSNADLSHRFTANTTIDAIKQEAQRQERERIGLIVSVSEYCPLKLTDDWSLSKCGTYPPGDCPKCLADYWQALRGDKGE